MSVGDPLVLKRQEWGQKIKKNNADSEHWRWRDPVLNASFKITSSSFVFNDLEVTDTTAVVVVVVVERGPFEEILTFWTIFLAKITGWCKSYQITGWRKTFNSSSSS